MTKIYSNLSRYLIVFVMFIVLAGVLSACDTKTDDAIIQTGNLTYNGMPQTPTLQNNLVEECGEDVVVTYSTSLDGEYSTTIPTFINAGNYKIFYKASISNKEIKTGSINIKVNPKNISGATISGLVDCVYNGEEVTPAYSVSDVLSDNLDSVDLVNGTDFTSVFANNVNVGRASLIITGNGNYTGTKVATFNITNASINGSITQSGTLANNGSAQPILNNSLMAVGNQIISVTYGVNENSIFSTAVPTFASAGNFTIYYKATAPNHSEKLGSISIVIEESNIQSDKITLTILNAVNYFYINGSLYSKSVDKYYMCSNCLEYSTTFNSLDCLSGSHSYSAYTMECTECNAWTSTCYHNYSATCSSCNGSGSKDCSECHGDTGQSYFCNSCGGSRVEDCSVCSGSGNCQSCDGSGVCHSCGGDGVTTGGWTGNTVYGCSSCGGSGGGIWDGDVVQGSGVCSLCSGGACSSCDGTGEQTCSTCDGEGGFFDACDACGGSGGESCDSCGGCGTITLSKNFATITVYKCSTCSGTSYSSTGTGCYHNHSLAGYKYTRQYGAGESIIYSADAYTTGYYWNETYGALKVDSTFTYSDGEEYIVTAISGTTLTARKYDAV